MNKLILIVLVFVLFCASCKNANTNAELGQIDSLLQQNKPEIAYESLSALNTENFSKGDRAYYDLLLTEAQYKNYVPFASDSIINSVVNYYERNSDGNKYTRALIFQGCVYEDLAKPEMAINCFNLAEEAAPKEALSDIAYAKLKMGDVYNLSPIGNSTIALNKFQEALSLYYKLNDKHYQMICQTEIGSIYRSIKGKEDSVEYYINKAIEIAKVEEDSFFIYSNMFLLAEFYSEVKHDDNKAKDFAVTALEFCPDPSFPESYYVLATSYARLHQIDSAEIVLKNAPKKSTSLDSLHYFQTLYEIERSKNNPQLALQNYLKVDTISDSILVAGLNDKLLAVEKKYDKKEQELKNEQLSSRLNYSMFGLSIIVLICVVLLLLILRYRQSIKQKEVEYEMLSSDLRDSVAGLEQMQARLKNYENKIENAQRVALEKQQEIEETTHDLTRTAEECDKLNQSILSMKSKLDASDEMRKIIDRQIQAIHELVILSYEHPGDKFRKYFNKFITVPSKQIKADLSYWSSIKALTNDLYRNVLDVAQEESGNTLREDELNYLALFCCGYSRTAIMICLQYTNIRTVYNKRKQIAAKLGVKSLEDYVAQFQETEKMSA